MLTKYGMFATCIDQLQISAGTIQTFSNTMCRASAKVVVCFGIRRKTDLKEGEGI